MAREFKDFVSEKMINETDDDWFNRRMAQFQAASQGVKGAITDDRTGPAKYTPPAGTTTPPPAGGPMKWVQLRDGFYEQMTPEDEAAGLTTLSRWMNPARNGAYYTQRKSDGRWIIVRPNNRLAAANRGSF